MPTLNVLPGEGTALAYAAVSSNGTIGSYTTIAHRVSINGPDITVNSVEKTTLDSTFHEYRPSQIPEPGENNFTIYYDPAGHVALLNMVLPQTTQGANVVSWKLTFAPPVGSAVDTSGGTLTGLGFINKFALKGMEIDGNLSADVTIKYTGPLTPG